MLGHCIWYPQLQTSHNRHFCYEHPQTLSGFISHHPMGLRTRLDPDVCSSSSIRESDEGPGGPRGQHSILSSRWRWRSESRVQELCFSRRGVLSLPEICQSRALVKLKAKKWGSTLLFFSGRNCKVTRQGAWTLGDVENCSSELITCSDSLTCILSTSSRKPVLPRRAGVHKVMGNTLVYTRTCFNTGSFDIHRFSLVHALASLPIFLWNSYKPKLFLDSCWNTCYGQNKLTGFFWEAWESSSVHHDFTTVRICLNMHGSKLNLKGFMLKTSWLLLSVFPVFS